MSTTKNALEMFEANGGRWDKSIGVLDIGSPHLLTQIAGYAKYKKGTVSAAVFFRGQGEHYTTMKSGIYRSKNKYSMNFVDDRHAKINRYVKSCIDAKAVLNGTPDRAVEPLLQHYGLRTRWLDFVDNIWVALWFACHDYFSCGRFGEFAHFERRSLGGGPKHAYIIISSFANLAAIDGNPGFLQNDNFEFCDLRIASPSLYIRPHAQHGVMVRKRKISTVEHTDMSESVFGVLRMSLTDALNWLGGGELLSIHSLFPPPYYDLGYRFLLENAIASERDLGSITYIGS